jgi:hypothetical protein
VGVSYERAVSLKIWPPGEGVPLKAPISCYCVGFWELLAMSKPALNSIEPRDRGGRNGGTGWLHQEGQEGEMGDRASGGTGGRNGG